VGAAATIVVLAGLLVLRAGPTAAEVGPPVVTQTVTAPPTLTTAPVPTVTETFTAAPSPTVTDEPADPDPEPGSAESSDPDPAEPVTFVMPDVVGMYLQDAQNLLQKLGSYAMDQQDATGKGRNQVWDRNWKVCTQEPAVEAVIPVDTVVVLGAVKLKERCP